jgi:hypothetical protein
VECFAHRCQARERQGELLRRDRRALLRHRFCCAAKDYGPPFAALQDIIWA